MLTPDQIDAIRTQAGQLTDPVTDFLIRDIARRVSEAGQLTSTAAYQVWVAQQLGVSQREVKKRLRALLKVSAKQIEQLLTQSAEVGYRFDLDRLPTAAAIPFEDNAVLQQIVTAAVKLAEDDFTNLTQTLGMVDPYGNAQPLQKVYRRCTDYAFEQVATGAADYNTALRRATRNLVKYGVRTIDYESGVHTSLEAAVRRNIMGGLGLMQEQINEANHDMLGCDGWEISAHAASAPDHEPIQGRQYSDAEYQALNNSLVRRIGTLNCGHEAFPIILGVSSPQYTPEELEKLRADNAKGVTVNGRHYTTYQATQRQRQIERAIRKQKWKVAADEGAGDSEQLKVDKTKLTLLRKEYRDFSKAAGLRQQSDRLFVATGSGKTPQTLENPGNSSIMKTVGIEPIAITDEAIGKVPIVKPSGWSDEQAKRLQSAHQELLRCAQQEPIGTECGFLVDMDGMVVSRKVGDYLEIRMPESSFEHILIHNHPNNEPFSRSDIESFLWRGDTQGMTALGNDGVTVHGLFKTAKFDGYRASVALCKHSEGLKKAEEAVSKNKDTDSLDSYFGLLAKFLEELKAYGVEII